MGSNITLQNQSLAKIMNSASFGVVSSSGSGNLKKSSLFEGLAIIRSKFSSDYQKTNVQARTEFVSNLIKEFGFDPTGSSATKLKEDLCEGDIGKKPLSIRDAQKIIKDIATQTKLMTETKKANQDYNLEEMTRLAQQTLADPKMFTEDIGVVSRGVLKNNLISIRDKSGSNAMPEMLKAVESWLTLGGTEKKPGLAETIIREMFSMPDRSEAVGKMHEKLVDVTSDYNTVRGNPEAMSELRDYALELVKEYKLDPSEESITSLLRDAQVPL